MEDYHKELSKNNTTLPELEVLVHGNIESMITRKELISKKQLKLINKYNKNHGKSFDDCYIDSNEYSLKNRKGQFYPIETNLNEDNMIILNSEELCLFEDINYLKSIGIFNFSIDARWKSLEYIEDIGKAYRELIDEKTDDIDESKKTIDKHCPNLTKANFDKGLK